MRIKVQVAEGDFEFESLTSMVMVLRDVGMSLETREPDGWMRLSPEEYRRTLQVLHEAVNLLASAEARDGEHVDWAEVDPDRVVERGERCRQS